MLISPNPINHEKLVKTPVIPNSNIFPYQKSQDHTRWVVKRSQITSFHNLMLHLQKIMHGSNHDHPAIISIHKFYLDISKSNPNEFTVYEKLPRMKRSLQSDILNQRLFSQNDIVTIAYDLICGVESLHNKGIPHCNIKPTNIFIENNGRAKLSDINLHVVKQGENQLYMAPEIQKAEHGQKKRLLFQADMWSIGVILAELCLNQTGLMKEKDMEDKLQELKGKYPKNIVDLLSFLIEENDHRLSAKDARKHLEKNYPELCNYYPRKETILDQKIHNIKEEFASRYKEIYKLQDNKPFSISTLDGTKSTNETIGELFHFLQSPDFNAELKHSYSFEFDATSYFTFVTLAISDYRSHLIDENAVSTVNSYIENRLQNLVQLNLNFTYCDRIDDKALEKLCHESSNLAELSELSLQFRWCKKVTDVGLQNLASHIPKQWKDLRFLTLDFRNCPKITSEGIERLSKNFAEKLPSLQTLKLMFSGEIDDKGIKILHLLIGSGLPKLQDLSLSFEECSKISVKTFKEFCQHIKQRSIKLTNLKLDFTGCNNLVDNLSLKELKNIRDELNFLKIFELKLI